MFAGLATMFVGGALGVEVVAAVGLALLVGGPMVGGTVGDVVSAYAEDDAAATGEDPLAELRRRYARGEVSEAEFERTVDRLLATEDVATAERETELA